jgi:hypothetical protein
VLSTLLGDGAPVKESAGDGAMTLPGDWVDDGLGAIRFVLFIELINCPLPTPASPPAAAGDGTGAFCVMAPVPAKSIVCIECIVTKVMLAN